MATSTWTSTNNASFNIIKDGKPVDAKTVNHTFNNIEGNLEYLYDKVGALESDSSSIVAYQGLIKTNVTVTDLRPGTPVYWSDGWAPAQLNTAESTSNSSPYHWDFKPEALAQGIVIRCHDALGTVDVCLSGKVVFDIIGSSNTYYVVAEGETVTSAGNRFSKLFDDSSFTDTERTPDKFKPGVQYLSEAKGKLTYSSIYPRALAVMVMDSDDAGEYQLNTLVCPEGFSGDRVHTHNRIALSTEFAHTGDLKYDNIPDAWYPDTSTSGKRLLNTALAEIETDSVVYPYSELIGTSGVSNAEYVAQIYPTGGTKQAGWESAWGTSAPIPGAPADAIWRFAVEEVDELAASASDDKWNIPVNPDHIVLVMDGVPVPNSYYKINESGIWWVAKGVEHAPISALFKDISEESGIEPTTLDLIFVEPVGELAGGALTEITSKELIASEVGGVVNVETKDTYMSQVLTPVLPFNPMDDIERASIAETEEALSNKIITPLLAKHAINHFASLTQLDANRTCKQHRGDWGDLITTGFYQITGATDGPPYSTEAVPMGMVVANGMSAFQLEVGHGASYIRKGRPEAEVVSWGEWMLITEKPYDPIYLPVSTNKNIPASSDISLREHTGRTIISRDESTNIVNVPQLHGAGYEDGLDFRFVSQMNPGSEASTLIIKLSDTLAGYNGSYLVCPGQACEEAYQHMGQGVYTTINDDSVVGVPNYLDVSITASHTSADDLDAIAAGDTVAGTGSSPHHNPRYVKFECEAPQYYGSNSIQLEVLGGAWVITGGYGVWFILNATEYTAYTNSGPGVTGLLGKLLQRATPVVTGSNIMSYDNSKVAVKFATRHLRVGITGSAVALTKWGRANFNSSGGII